MKSFCFIIAYFGKFNNYFNLWLESCRCNPTVDWYIITDNDSEYDYPDNVHRIICSMDELRERVQSKFDFPISLKYPYKLCDLKPAYGYIFDDIIKDYDYWGWCDVDVIYGDIRKFFPDETIEGYDMLSEYGHFCLLRNSEKMNRLFMTALEDIPDYRQCFGDDMNYIFDEVAFRLFARHRDVKIFSVEDKFFDADPFVREFKPCRHNKGFNKNARYIFEFNSQKSQWGG